MLLFRHACLVALRGITQKAGVKVISHMTTHMTIEEYQATAVHLNVIILITFMSLKTPQFIRSIFKLYILPLYTPYMYMLKF